MKTSSKKIQERNTFPINASDSFKEKLIALACISFFPLVYLIGSTIVKYFG